MIVDYLYRKVCKCECCGYYNQHFDFDICPNCGEEDLIVRAVLRKKVEFDKPKWYKPWTLNDDINYKFDGWGRLPEHMECKKVK